MRLKLRYVLMSLFVLWQGIAIVVTAAPTELASTAALAPIFAPYYKFFALNSSPWAFYTPSISPGYHLRYSIEDAEGRQHVFEPSNELNTLLSDDWWFRAWHDAVASDSESYGEHAIAVFCRKHAALRPIKIALQRVDERQTEFYPADHLAGKRPMDPEFISVTELMTDTCPEQ
jgi:hypothetical protein